MARLEMFSDIHCPYAYLAAYRLREALRAFRGEVEVVHRSLAIEHLDAKTTPFDILAQETPIILLEEPDVPYAPWHAPLWAWPVTLWPAFEAVKCAERQGWEPAHELDWRLREAFFAKSLCVSARHVILQLAKDVPGLDARRFEDDFDSGVAKRQVIEESRDGWEHRKMEVSPTFVLPSGRMLANPAAPVVHLDEENHLRVRKVDPAPERGEAARERYRAMLREAARG